MVQSEALWMRQDQPLHCLCQRQLYPTSRRDLLATKNVQLHKNNTTNGEEVRGSCGNTGRRPVSNPFSFIFLSKLRCSIPPPSSPGTALKTFLFIQFASHSDSTTRHPTANCPPPPPLSTRLVTSSVRQYTTHLRHGILFVCLFADTFLTAQNSLYPKLHGKRQLRRRRWKDNENLHFPQ
jgi:hypothetical protein